MDERPDGSGTGGDADATAAFAALVEDSAEELYESAPCGYLSTLMDGTIARINTTLLQWLGLERDAVVGRRHFADLLTVGGQIYHETHFAPLLRMQGELRAVALEMRMAGGGRLPVLVSSSVKYAAEGEPLLIRTTVVDASDRRAYEQELLRRRRSAEAARAEAERARAEAQEARRQSEADRARLAAALSVLQRSLLPPALPRVPGLETAVYYHTASAEQLGGDFYDLVPVDGERWAFFLGDVCGKGPEAASLTSLARYTLRAAALHDPEPAAALATLNSVLYQRYTAHGDLRYCTCVFGLVEPAAQSRRAVIRFACGGHPPALVLRADGRAEYLATPGGALIGVVPSARIATAETVLHEGETLLLYTDGLTEARVPPPGDRYGEQDLLAFVSELAPASAQETVDSLAGLLESFGDGLIDDTALLALGVAPSRARTQPAANARR